MEMTSSPRLLTPSSCDDGKALLPFATGRKRGFKACVTSPTVAIACSISSIALLLLYFFAVPPVLQSFLDKSSIVVLKAQLLAPEIGGSFVPIYATGDLAEARSPLQLTATDINAKFRQSETKVLHRFCLYCKKQDLYVKIRGAIPPEFDVFELISLGARDEHVHLISLHDSLEDALNNGTSLPLPRQLGFPGHSWLKGNTVTTGRVAKSRMDYVAIGDECTEGMPVWVRQGRDFVRGETLRCPHKDNVTVRVVDDDALAYLGAQRTFMRANVSRRFLPGHVVWLDVSQLGRKDWTLQWERVTVLNVTTKHELFDSDEKYIDYQAYPTYTLLRQDNTKVNITSLAVKADAGQTSVMYYIHMPGHKAEQLEKSVGCVQVISHLELQNAGPMPVKILPAMLDVGVMTSAGFDKFGKMELTEMDTSLTVQEMKTHLYVYNSSLFKKVMAPQFAGHNVTWHMQGNIAMKTTAGTWQLNLSQALTLPGAALSDVSGSLLQGREFVTGSGEEDSIKLRVNNVLQFVKDVVIGDEKDLSQGLGFFVFDLLSPDEAVEVSGEMRQREAILAFLGTQENKGNNVLRNIYDKWKYGDTSCVALLKELLTKGLRIPGGGLNVATHREDTVSVVKYRISGASSAKPKLMMYRTTKVGRVTIPNFKAFYGVPPDTAVVSQLIRTPENAESIRLVLERTSNGMDAEMMIYGPVRSFAPFFQIGLAQDLLLRGLPDANLLRWIQVVQDYTLQGFPVDCKQLFEHNSDRTDLDGICNKKAPGKIRVPGALSAVKNPFNIPLVMSDVNVDVTFDSALNYTAKLFKKSTWKGFDLYECTKPTAKFAGSIPGAKVDFGKEGRGTQSSRNTSDIVRVQAGKFGSMLLPVKPLQQKSGNDIHADPGRHSFVTDHAGLCAKMTKDIFSTPKGLSCCFAFMPLASSCRGWPVSEQPGVLDADIELMKVENELQENTMEARRSWIEENLFEDLVNVNGSFTVALEKFVVRNVGYKQRAVPLLGQRQFKIDMFHGKMQWLDPIKNPTCDYITEHIDRDSLTMQA